MSGSSLDELKYDRPFAERHIGPNKNAIDKMLSFLEYKSLDQLIDTAIPKSIRSKKDMRLPPAKNEFEALKEIRGIAQQNQVNRSYIGCGYYGCITPPVIQRNILENPGWYTQYTPYQAEISQGRLESLLNFQTMIIDLTGLAVANASVLDEATAAAEAMTLAFAVAGEDATKSFFISKDCLPQTIEVVKTRAIPRGIKVVVGDHREFDFSTPIYAALLQYPSVEGEIFDYEPFIKKLKSQGGAAILAADILALTVLKSPGEIGADIAVGSTQRFGVPLGYGGPHAAYLATKEEYLRRIPGRMVGVSKDAHGKRAVRLSLQTREQHIRREKATSNICTSQVLLANIAAMYAVYHGAEGLRNIAMRVNAMTRLFVTGLTGAGINVANKHYFDTVRINLDKKTQQNILKTAAEKNINLRIIGEEAVSVSIDETTTIDHVEDLLAVFTHKTASTQDLQKNLPASLPANYIRKSAYLTHPTFNSYHSETELMRYIRRLEAADLSLTTSMISLGSCTMKLNAAAELMPITWPELNGVHPFAPLEQVKGYQALFKQLESMLCELTGFAAFSLQPNSGAQGEYAGLLVIRKYHEANGDLGRNVCLIPSSAHGTNPASAAMAGMKVVVVKCDEGGNVDLGDLQAKAQQHKDSLSALMITYPSTHGVFEEGIREICDIVHQNGGQVYMDGANMNAQVGLCLPGTFGPDVCHLNLHKTFCIPHGGGGPGVGPIGVAKHLAPYLPNHPCVDMKIKSSTGPVAAAPWGSASILPISWMYIRMMGVDGLTHATKVAILNANYMAKRLHPHFPVLYQGHEGLVAHECIVDLRQLKKTSGIEVEDVAKRLMDYGFHAPTMSFPVPGTLMIEPTESESKEELDRFCDAMIAIRKEIKDIEDGRSDRQNNVLKNAPHTAEFVTRNAWDLPYSREQAAYPAPWTKNYKFWPRVGRIDNAFGDRNFVCSCPPVEDYED